MFVNINGVQIKEYDETKAFPNLLDKQFMIEYLDNVYLHKLVCLDFINIAVQSHRPKFGRGKVKELGRHWMFVVKHSDYAENRSKYAEVGCIVHDKIAEYLNKEYGYDPEGIRLLDCEENLRSSVK